MHLFKTALAAAAIAVGGGAASASSLQNAGDNFAWLFSDSSLGVDLTAQIYVELGGVSVSGTTATWSLLVDVYNTTLLSENGVNRLSIWGFNTDPEASVDTTQVIDGSGDWFLVDGGNVPSGLGQYQVCAKEDGGANNCAGGGSGGILEQASESFSFDIETSTVDPLILNFESLFVRYQSVNGDLSIAFTGEECPDGPFQPGAPPCRPGEPPEVPLPAGLPLFLSGLVASGYIIRKRKAA